MFELPSELRVLSYDNQSIDFSYGMGEVIRRNRYPISPDTLGSFHSVYFRNQSVDVLDVWIKSDDGKEINCQLYKPNIGVLEGHRVKFVLGKSSAMEPSTTVMFFNLTTDDGYSMNVGGVYFLLRDNPKGFFKNPQKRQSEFEEFVHRHCVNIAKHIFAKHG